MIVLGVELDVFMDIGLRLIRLNLRKKVYLLFSQ